MRQSLLCWLIIVGGLQNAESESVTMLLAARWLFCVYFYPLTFRCSRLQMENGNTHSHSHCWLLSVACRCASFFQHLQPIRWIFFIHHTATVWCLIRSSMFVLLRQKRGLLAPSYVCVCFGRLYCIFIFIYLRFISIFIPQESEKWKCTKITNKICVCVCAE